jgi:ribosomal protein L12E/L44/L45/RPP1/RPP2
VKELVVEKPEVMAARTATGAGNGRKREEPLAEREREREKKKLAEEREILAMGSS